MRTSLPARVAEAVLARIGNGTWTRWLPGERQIGRLLQVSRGTVRSALAILQQRRQVAPVPGSGYRVIRRGARRIASGREVSIGLLSGEPLETKRPYFALMIGQIREAAQARGWRVTPHHGGHYFGARAERNLARLAQSVPASCWVLFHSTPRAQQWFAGSGVPALVSGHTYDGIALPSLDADFRAGGRHAGAQLARFGHRRVAAIRSAQRLPGLIEGEAGFAEGFGAATKGRGVVVPVAFSGEVATLARHLTRLMGPLTRPTVVLSETPNQYLTVVSALAQLRLVVPDDVSVVCRLDDPFLEHLTPEPTRYRVSPFVFARALVRLAAHLVAGENVPCDRRLLMPSFVRGGSLGPAPLPPA